MKKLSAYLFAALLALAVLPNSAWAANCDETPLDKAWDWATTLGKSGAAKDEILAKNKTERVKKCIEKTAKQAQKDAGKAVDDLQKKMGL